MSKIMKMTLYGGPFDGDTVEIHRDNLKIKPIVSCTNDRGDLAEYALDDEGKFVWLPDPADPKVRRGVFVCDDDGNVISEERSVADALDKLQELEDEEEDDA